MVKSAAEGLRETAGTLVRLACIILVVVVVAAHGGVGGIEGRLWPAAAPMTLTRVEAAPGGSEIWGTSARLRPECSFAGFDWRLERGGRSTVVDVRTGPALVRPNGPFEFGPWALNITPEEFADTRGRVRHRCRWFRSDTGWRGLVNRYLPRWETVSPFWRP